MDPRLEQYLRERRLKAQSLPAEAQEAGREEELTFLKEAIDSLLEERKSYRDATFAVEDEIAFVMRRIDRLKAKRVPLLSPQQHRVVRSLLDPRR